MNTFSAEQIFLIRNSKEFEKLALDIFRFQAEFNPVYNRYLELMALNPLKISCLEEIPFLPIEFFRTREVISGELEAEIVFESSGTTGDNRSRHYIVDSSLYQESFNRCFQYFFGTPDHYCILALLPSYLERQESSLVYMADHLIRSSNHPASGFYLDDLNGLSEKLKQLESAGQKSILLGVSFALLDLAEKHAMPLKQTIVMETGGMKGRRKELTRQELHSILSDAFSLKSVYSEYGMTELLSQAYSKINGIFHCPPWMKVSIRDPYDPLSAIRRESSGGINIIDLANIHSCSFLATQDLGKTAPDDSFEVLGRFDNSELRGCNLMI
jgi:phenylacetate-coenzyme A ligase PaaK-like adenylate-forming protein